MEHEMIAKCIGASYLTMFAIVLLMDWVMETDYMNGKGGWKTPLKTHEKWITLFLLHLAVVIGVSIGYFITQGFYPVSSAALSYAMGDYIEPAVHLARAPKNEPVVLSCGFTTIATAILHGYYRLSVSESRSSAEINKMYAPRVKTHMDPGKSITELIDSL